MSQPPFGDPGVCPTIALFSYTTNQSPIGGSFSTTWIRLKSHVTLQLDKGATLLGSPHQPDYRKVNFHGLLLADRQQDITICGKGVIDGQGTLLAADTERLWKAGKLPTATEGQRPMLINFRNCTNDSPTGDFSTRPGSRLRPDQRRLPDSIVVNAEDRTCRSVHPRARDSPS